MRLLASILFALSIPVMGVATGSDTTDGASQNTVIRLSEPIFVTETHEVFGASMPASKHAMTLAELIENSQRHLGTEVVISTEIVKVCQKKGCFFIARDGDAIARVTFLDYGFFIPTDAGGKMVTLAGTFNREILTQTQSEHLASDLGEPVAKGDPLKFVIVASSVSIPKR